MAIAAFLYQLHFAMGRPIESCACLHFQKQTWLDILFTLTSTRGVYQASLVSQGFFGKQQAMVLGKMLAIESFAERRDLYF